MALLILLRHAKAVPHGEAKADRDRALTDRGHSDAWSAGGALALSGLRPAIALVSPAVRTVQTWEVASAAWPAPPPHQIVEALYHSDVQTLWRFASESADGSALVVGHNPTLHDLAALLIRQLPPPKAEATTFLDGFPTSAWVAFDCAGDRPTEAAPTFVAGWRPPRD